ncbi:YihY/virulence factor BrkB family protein [Mesorhizobium sp. B2-5-9]|uniref:YihY/virulence factor BrkB family protein n=1 Tax=unclassified Mesorhizobium TaxID=325217 RepID=UPI0011261885|nr:MULTISPECIES: YihY/virulence factor BrkB family protein [unclassified Mesorhizobium]TPK12827.1 YihY/virulence factor BrkB family protein [Mesorhizobium sp. B2-5-9]TPK86219.1 YihY/virulence factor BrkB family protein [Mesorhizobium sp. B2-4-13]
MALKPQRGSPPNDKQPSLIDEEAASRAASTRKDSNATAGREPGSRGRDATWPSQITGLGWKDIFWRLWEEFNKDRVLLVAAGATFYLLLALFPALAAFISIYGFVADPVTVADHVAYLQGLLPQGGLDLIRDQLQALARQKAGALGTGFFIGLTIALWSANSGMKALFDAMNIAYEEREKRSFITLNLMSILFTVGALLIGIVLLLTVGVVPALLRFFYLDAWTETVVAVSRWPILVVSILTGISLLYRFGPSREHAKWRWLSWGALAATAAWIIASWLFSFYLQHFANYNATYGSLGAVVGLMMWTWISVIILIAGAAINAEMEHQTACDSTTGPAVPMGERGAVVADTLGKTAD